MSKVARPDLRISECFVSIQGEGPSQGRPAAFIRLQGCSVGCSWCDSKYTWEPSGGEALDAQTAVSQMMEGTCPTLLVITGGEPLEVAGFPDLLTWASNFWWRIEVETSGVLPPIPATKAVRWNWSPKLSSVTPRADETWAYAKRFVRSKRAICKVVVSDEADWNEALERLCDWDVPPERTWIMPQGIEKEALLERARWLAPLCIEQGFRLTNRLHILLWGARRGV